MLIHGQPGEEVSLELILRVVADVGLVVCVSLFYISHGFGLASQFWEQESVQIIPSSLYIVHKNLAQNNVPYIRKFQDIGRIWFGKVYIVIIPHGFRCFTFLFLGFIYAISLQSPLFA